MIPYPYGVNLKIKGSYLLNLIYQVHEGTLDQSLLFYIKEVGLHLFFISLARFFNDFGFIMVIFADDPVVVNVPPCSIK